ncbi:predicted protein [Streptomyces sp. C]|nr:predicted protein [Streptomyces sp. C]
MRDVSASGFYRWINAAATQVACMVADEDPGAWIEEIHEEANGTYGVARITRDVQGAGRPVTVWSC